MGNVLERLREVLDELVELDPQSLASADDVLELHRQMDRLDAVTTRSLAAFDVSKAWMGSRSRSAAHWLAWQRHMPLSTARRRLRCGRGLRSMPFAERAWLDGDIGTAHVTALGKARPPETEDASTVTRSCWSMTPVSSRTRAFSGWWSTGSSTPTRWL